VDVLHLGRVGGQRVCADCHRARARGSSAPPGESRSGSLATFRRIDACTRAAAVTLRLLLYLGLYQLAKNTDLVSWILAGFLLADALTWLAAAWLDRHFHSAEVVGEALLYSAAIVLWLHFTGGLQLPADAAGRAIMCLSFFGTLSIKGTFQTWRLMHGERPGA